MWTFLFRSRHSWLLGVPTGILGVGLLLAPGIGSWGGFGSNAWAEAAPSPSVAPQRVRELEQRVKILELEQETLDRRMKLETERTGRALEELEMRILALEGNARQGEVAAAKPEKSVTDDVCKDPYIHFPNGIRRVKAGCEDMAKPCDAPEVVDERGVWSVRPECVPANPTKESNCAVPYVVDPKGIKQFKPECL